MPWAPSGSPPLPSRSASSSTARLELQAGGQAEKEGQQQHVRQWWWLVAAGCQLAQPQQSNTHNTHTAFSPAPPSPHLKVLVRLMGLPRAPSCLAASPPREGGTAWSTADTAGKSVSEHDGANMMA